jgi:DNA-binding beta-propeller fold protein YncE
MRRGERHRWARGGLLLVAIVAAGCGGSGGGSLEVAWGKRGTMPGSFVRPRALACDTRPGQDLIYVADFSGRIQVFNHDGKYLRGWTTPTIANGRPAGLGMAADGNLLVADSHYGRILTYSPDGRLLKEIHPERGDGPGPLAYVADVAQDADGFFYVTEFGEDDRVRKLSPQGSYVKHWGSHGSGQGQFSRPRGLVVGGNGDVYVADSCNHRIQVFDREGTLQRVLGRQGREPGELDYPYDVALNVDGDVFVVEYGNNRVQRLAPTGEPKGTWGGPGREPGKLNNPWGLAIDRRGRVFVADSDNHRIQRLGS